MSKVISELDALRTLDDSLAALPDEAARARVLKWAWEKYAPSHTKPMDAAAEEDTKTKKSRTRRKLRASASGGASAKPRTKQAPLSIVRDLNLRPKGKEDFATFAEKKAPKSNEQKCVVCVYYLANELGLTNISPSHVLTCFKAAKWRVPADLPNTLSLASFRHGWLDTGNQADIRVSTVGENLIDHDLPASPKGRSA
jgi:hypothetical protein